MKTMIKYLLLAVLALATLPMTAQPHLEEAFKKLVTSPDVKTSRISNQITDGETTGKLEVYVLSLQKDDPMFTKLLGAFKKDANLSYSYIAHDGKKDKKEAYQVYKDGNNSVVIGKNAEDNYRLFCIMAPSTNDKKNYRYCYAVEWKNEGSKITGRAIKSYMPRPQKKKMKYKSYFENTKELEDLGENIQGLVGDVISIAGDSLQMILDQYDMDNIYDEDNGTSRIKIYRNNVKEYNTGESFLTRFNFLRNRYKEFIEKGDKGKSALAQSYSTRILTLCRKAPKDKLSSRMFNQCVKSIKELQNMTKDDFTRAIFDEAIDALEKE